MEDILDDVQQVVTQLETILPIGKHTNALDRDEIFLLLANLDGENKDTEHETDTGTEYHPVYRVSKVIGVIVERFFRSREKEDTAEDFEVVPAYVDNNYSDILDSSFESEQDFNQNRSMLLSFVHNYPDVDPRDLKSKCESLRYNVELVQEWLNKNIDSLPEKKQVQALSRLALQDQLRPDQRMSSCPVCGAWYSVCGGESVVICIEIGCGGAWCVLCGRGDHRPLPCRGECDRLRRAEREVNIFTKVLTMPDKVVGPVRLFKMLPRNDLDFTDPLQILYLAAEATFLRMVDKSGQGNTVGRKIIKNIEYVENEETSSVFLQKKAKFLADQIPHNERLVFHGTKESNIDKILEENFRLDKCHRFAHGKGVYFSEFPAISLGYGVGLLLCRVMLGRTYSGAGLPEGWDSKLVAPDSEGKGQMVVIPDTKQILPAFVIRL